MYKALALHTHCLNITPCCYSPYLLNREAPRAASGADLPLGPDHPRAEVLAEVLRMPCETSEDERSIYGAFCACICHVFMLRVWIFGEQTQRVHHGTIFAALLVLLQLMHPRTRSAYAFRPLGGMDNCIERHGVDVDREHLHARHGNDPVTVQWFYVARRRHVPHLSPYDFNNTENSLR